MQQRAAGRNWRRSCLSGQGFAGVLLITRQGSLDPAGAAKVIIFSPEKRG
jgi:hypothetical protein